MRKAEIDRKFDEIVDFAEIEKFLDTPVKRYSSGMYVRLAFAVAAHLEPEILIVDEVLAVGDTAFQRKCVDKIESIGNEGRTVLVVSHNMGSIARLCTSAIYLIDGSVRVTHSVQDCISQYHKSLTQHATTQTSSSASLGITLAGEKEAFLNSWEVGHVLTVDIDVTARLPAERQAVDLAFYTEDGVRVFSLQSDRMPGARVAASGTSSQYRFRIVNPGFLCPLLTLDVGVRAIGSQEYEGLWERAALVNTSSDQLTRYGSSGSLLCPLNAVLATRSPVC
jgi:lipopolysaccharide transport system ATP-binding protein